jgi:hypothetical protein
MVDTLPGLDDPVGGLAAAWAFHGLFNVFMAELDIATLFLTSAAWYDVSFLSDSGSWWVASMSKRFMMTSTDSGVMEPARSMRVPTASPEQTEAAKKVD